MEDTIIVGGIVITPLVKAHKSLSDVMAMPFTDVVRDAAIKRFEYTFELSWKSLKKVLAHKGVEVNSPRDVFRAASKESIIDDPDLWFQYLKQRNLTSHTYDEDTAEEIYALLNHFVVMVDNLIERLKAYE